MLHQPARQRRAGADVHENPPPPVRRRAAWGASVRAWGGSRSPGSGGAPAACAARHASTASVPVAATVGRWPSFASSERVSSALISLSSATRTVSAVAADAAGRGRSVSPRLSPPPPNPPRPPPHPPPTPP